MAVGGAINGAALEGKLDEAALEGKNPKVIQKQYANIEISLNGGIDKNADPDANHNNDPLREDHASISNDETPSYNDELYDNPGNKVVEPEDYRSNKAANLPQKEFPQGRFN